MEGEGDTYISVIGKFLKENSELLFKIVKGNQIKIEGDNFNLELSSFNTFIVKGLRLIIEKGDIRLIFLLENGELEVYFDYPAIYDLEEVENKFSDVREAEEIINKIKMVGKN